MMFTYLDLDGNVTARHQKKKRNEHLQEFWNEKGELMRYLATFSRDGEIATLQRVKKE